MLHIGKICWKPTVTLETMVISLNFLNVVNQNSTGLVTVEMVITFEEFIKKKLKQRTSFGWQRMKLLDKFTSNTKVQRRKKCTPVQSITMRYSSGEMRKAQGVFTSPQLRLWVQTAAVRGEGRPMPWPTRPSWIRHTLSRTNKKARTHTQKLVVQCEHVMWQWSRSQPCGQGESCRSAVSVTDPQRHTIRILLQSHGCSFVPAVMSLPLHQSEWARLWRPNECLE